MTAEAAVDIRAAAIGCFDRRCASRWWGSLQTVSGTRAQHRCCPHGAASYQLVYVEAEDTASDGELTCLQCAMVRCQAATAASFSGPEAQAAVHAIVTPTGQIRIGAVLRLRLFPC